MEVSLKTKHNKNNIRILKLKILNKLRMRQQALIMHLGAKAKSYQKKTQRIWVILTKVSF